MGLPFSLGEVMRDQLLVHDDDHLAIVHEVSTDALRASADYAADIRNSGYNAAKGDMGLVASVDPYMVKAFCVAKGVDWKEFFRSSALMTEFLNQPEIEAFRTYKGRI